MPVSAFRSSSSIFRESTCISLVEHLHLFIELPHGLIELAHLHVERPHLAVEIAHLPVDLTPLLVEGATVGFAL